MYTFGLSVGFGQNYVAMKASGETEKNRAYKISNMHSTFIDPPTYSS